MLRWLHRRDGYWPALQRQAAAAATRASRRRSLATVAVGISGGVDSSVAALLLKEEGHDVIGVHMSNWDPAEEGSEACTEREARDAERVCTHLGIGFQRVSFVREYWHEVFEPLLRGYHDGGTPNPDVACNQQIKFDHFTRHVLSLGADRVATGHYARVDRDAHGTARLLCATDSVKDQTYFLSRVPQAALQVSEFPIGHLMKEEVRARAAAAELHTATKRDSMGICFIGKRKFGEFLEGYLPQTPGAFVCVESGRKVGEHRGYALYTPGQRARVSGQSTRWYVVDKDARSNVVIIARGSDHPALFTRGLVAEKAAWISGEAPTELLAGRPLACTARIRHPGILSHVIIDAEYPPAEYPPATAPAAAPPAACMPAAEHAGRPRTHEGFVEGRLEGPVEGREHSGLLHVHFDAPMRDVAEMQSIAIYEGEVCVHAYMCNMRT